MNPELPLDGRIYTLTVSRVLTTNVSQINPGQLLFRATLKVWLGSLLLKIDAPNEFFEKFTACLVYS